MLLRVCQTVGRVGSRKIQNMRIVLKQIIRVTRVLHTVRNIQNFLRDTRLIFLYVCVQICI